MKKLFLAILFLFVFSINSFAAIGGATTIKITSVTLTTSGTEYSFTFPEGTQNIMFNGTNPASTDKVATSATYTSTAYSYNFNITPITIINLSTYGSQTLYFQSNKNGENIQIIYTQ